MNGVSYRELWEQITLQLDSLPSDWGETIAQFGQIKAIEERNQGRRWSDNEIHSGLVRAVVSNNTDWSKIESVLPELNQLFKGFNLEYYAQLDGSDIEEKFIPWFKERRAGSMTLRKDLTNLINTAGISSEWSRNHGSAEQYFTSLMTRFANDPKKVALELGTPGSNYKLPALGGPIAAETLKNIGYNLAKPDRHILRAVGSFGLVTFAKWPDRSKAIPPRANTLRGVSVSYQSAFSLCLGDNLGCHLVGVSRALSTHPMKEDAGA